jgi:hypothetical protein
MQPARIKPHAKEHTNNPSRNKNENESGSLPGPSGPPVTRNLGIGSVDRDKHDVAGEHSPMSLVIIRVWTDRPPIPLCLVF